MANSSHYCLPTDATAGTAPSPSLTSAHPPTTTSPSRDHHHQLTSSRGSSGSSPSHQSLVKRSSAGSSPRSISVSPVHRIKTERWSRLSSSGSYIDVCSLPAIQLARQVSSYSKCLQCLIELQIEGQTPCYRICHHVPPCIILCIHPPMRVAYYIM